MKATCGRWNKTKWIEKKRREEALTRWTAASATSSYQPLMQQLAAATTTSHFSNVSVDVRPDTMKRVAGQEAGAAVAEHWKIRERLCAERREVRISLATLTHHLKTRKKQESTKVISSAMLKFLSLGVNSESNTRLSSQHHTALAFPNNPLSSKVRNQRLLASLLSVYTGEFAALREAPTFVLGAC